MLINSKGESFHSDGCQSNHCSAHLNILFVNYTSVKLEKNFKDKNVTGNQRRERENFHFERSLAFSLIYYNLSHLFHSININNQFYSLKIKLIHHQDKVLIQHSNV